MTRQPRCALREDGRTIRPAATRPPLFRLEVDGAVSPDILRIAQQALDELNRLSAQGRTGTAAVRLADALAEVRTSGRRAWLVSA